MSDNWLTEQGAHGQLLIEKRDGDWYTVNVGNEVRCVLRTDTEPEGNVVCRVTATVDRYTYAAGSSPDTAFLDVEGDVTVVRERSTGDAGSSSSYPVWDLADFSGSGEYVTVEATVNGIEYVQKDHGGMPDLKGELTDESVLSGVKFVINDGIGHPHMTVGDEFVFVGVKDHYYTKQGEVQVMITEDTDFRQT